MAYHHRAVIQSGCKLLDQLLPPRHHSSIRPSSTFSFFAIFMICRSNIAGTKSLSSPFGYNDCDDAQQYIQPSSSSQPLGHQVPGNPVGQTSVPGQRPYDSGSAASNDSRFNQFNQYPLPMPPLPPNAVPAHTVIGEIRQ